LAEIRDDFHRIVYAANADAARTAYTAFERGWAKRCSGVVTSLREGSDELLTFFRFPKAQWKTLRTTNTIERLHEEFRRRLKTPRWSCSSASWQAGRSSCAGSTAGGRFLRCSANTRRWRHDYQRCRTHRCPRFEPPRRATRCRGAADDEGHPDWIPKFSLPFR